MWTLRYQLRLCWISVDGANIENKRKKIVISRHRLSFNLNKWRAPEVEAAWACGLIGREKKETLGIEDFICRPVPLQSQNGRH